MAFSQIEYAGEHEMNQCSILRYRVCWRDGPLYHATLLRPRSRRLFQVLAVVGLPISARLSSELQTFGTNCVICLRSDHDLLMTENKLLSPWFTPRPPCQTSFTYFSSGSRLALVLSINLNSWPHLHTEKTALTSSGIKMTTFYWKCVY